MILLVAMFDALGRGAVRCRAGARVRGPGSGGRGWRALGWARCLRERGGGAAVPLLCILSYYYIV